MLYTWQEPNAEKLTNLFRSGSLIGLDGSETGTGKTYVSLQTLKNLGMKAVILCPKISRTSWARVAKEMEAASLVRDILNPEWLKTGKSEWWKDGKWRVPADTMLIWDECHRGTSGIGTETGKMLAMTKGYKIPVLGLSATLADTPLKMQALGYLLGLHDYTKGSFFAWCRANGCYKSKFHNGLDFPKGPRGRAIMVELHQKLSDWMVRTRISDVPEFPEGVLECNLYDLDQRATDEINSIWASMPEAVKKGGSDPLTESLRARQQTELLKVPLLSELTQDLLEEDKSVVVFVNFRDTLFKLEAALKAAGVTGIVKVMGVNGDREEKERQAGVDMFQANLSHVCLCMIQAGGISINLHDVKKERPRASLIIPSWSAVETVQALGRCHRAGGTKTLQTFVLAANTVEEKVYTAVKRKLANIAALNDGDLAP